MVYSTFPHHFSLSFSKFRFQIGALCVVDVITRNDLEEIIACDDVTIHKLLVECVFSKEKPKSSGESTALFIAG